MTTVDPEIQALASDLERDTPDVLRALRVAKYQAMKRFLLALFSPYEEGWIELRALRAKDTRRHWISIKTLRGEGCEERLKQAYRFVHDAEQDHFGVFVGVLPRIAAGRAKKIDIAQAGVVWCDLDFKVAGEDAAYAALEKCHPDIVVFSGNGLHPYWFLQKGVKELTNENRQLFEKALALVQQKALPGVDSVADVTRILRLPGSTNFAVPGDPNKKKDRPVRLGFCRSL